MKTTGVVSVFLAGPRLTQPFTSPVLRWLLLSTLHGGGRRSLVRARPPVCSHTRAKTDTFPSEVLCWPVRRSICLAELIFPKPVCPLQKDCKGSRGFPHTLHPASSHINTFHHHGTLSTLKTRRGALCFEKPLTLLGRHRFSHCCHCLVPGSHPGSLVTFVPPPAPPSWPVTVSRVSLFFTTLTVLRWAGCVSGRASLSLGFLPFPREESRDGMNAEVEGTQRTVPCLWRHVTYVTACVVTADGDLDHFLDRQMI